MLNENCAPANNSCEQWGFSGASIPEFKEINVDMQSLRGTRLMPSEKNVGSTERWISLFAGTALVSYGLSRGSASGIGLALVGGGLLLRGATGYCEINDALGRNTADVVGHPEGRARDL